MNKVQRFYNLLASVYDATMARERSQSKEWRRLLWSRVEGQAILEVGVGTGASFPFYPAGAVMTAVDFSSKMLIKAQVKAAQNRVPVSLTLMDVQQLGFQDGAFDSVVSSLVFCCVPDQIAGLKEAGRVLRPGGKLVMLEHVVSDIAASAVLMKLVNPLLSTLTGENIARKTPGAVTESGFIVEKVTRLSHIFRLIEARKGSKTPD